MSTKASYEELEHRVEFLEQQLREQQPVSSGAILNAIPDLLFRLDKDGTYLDIWAQDADELAASRDILLGNTVTEMLPPEAAELVMSALTEAAEKGTSHGQQIKLDTPKGEQWFELSTSLDTSCDAPHFIMLSRDITLRKTAEIQREESIKQLESALREINTLKGLLPICSYCHSIRDDEGAWSKLEEYISNHSGAEFSHGICPDCFEKISEQPKG